MNIIYRLLVLFIAIALSGCSFQIKDDKPPIDLIPQDSFAIVLHDIMLLESYYSAQEIDFRTLNEILPPAVSKIYEKHNMDSTRFVHSMDYYANNPQLLNQIYNTIQDSLTLETVGM